MKKYLLSTILSIVFLCGLLLQSYGIAAALPVGHGPTTAPAPAPAPGPTKTATWVDHSHLTIGGTTYVDDKMDGDLSYDDPGGSSCGSNTNRVNGFHPGDGGDGNATATLTTWAAVGGGNNNCQSTVSTVKFNGVQNFSDYFVWVDAGTIQTSDGTAMTFAQKGGSGPFYDDGSGRSSDTQCQSQIIPSSDPTHGTLIIRNSSDDNPFPTGFSPQISELGGSDFSPSNGCWVSKPLPVNIANPSNANQKPAGSGAEADNSDANTPSLSCDVNFNPLTWVICPAVQGMVSIVGDLDTAINSQLSVGTPGNSDDPNQIFCDRNTSSNDLNNCKAYYAAWSSFRDIALGLLAVVSLVIIISEMAGVELLDAYTLRKVLPRLIFAAIAITLSWQLMQFFVTLTNDIGYGVRFLIYQPFVHAGINSNGALDGGGIFSAGLIGVAAIGALGVFGLLSFAATAALAVFVAFLTLILRQILIIILVIVAPLAIVAYILPNTQNAFKLWWDSFSRALLMFPLIAAFIATGRVFSAVADSGSELGQLMGFIAYFAPYFMIPLTFRFAGGALRGLGGFVNDRHRGGFDRLGQYRKGKVDQNIAKTKNFSRVSDNNPLGRGINTALGAAANPRSMLRGRRGVRAARGASQSAHGSAFLKDNAIFQANAGDDNFLLAVANEDLAKQKLAKSMAKSQDTSLSAAERSEAQQDVYARQRAIDTARQMGRGRLSNGVRSSALNELGKTGFQFAQGEEGYRELSDTARSIAGGDERAYTGVMDQAQYNLRTAGRFDLGGINHGAGYDPTEGTNKASLYELANAKPQSIKAMTDGLSGPVGNEHAVVYRELEAMRPNAKGAARDEIGKQLDVLRSQGVDTYMAQSAGTGQTVETRKNYDAANAGHANWSADEKARGWRTERRDVTHGDLAQERARTYERPDPNNIP